MSNNVLRLSLISLPSRLIKMLGNTNNFLRSNHHVTCLETESFTYSRIMFTNYIMLKYF